MSKQLLTPQIVKDCSCPEHLQKILIFDQGCKNLVLEVTRTNKKTFYFRYQDMRGVTRQPKLSDARDISLVNARSLCDKYRGMLAMGQDPFSAKAELKQVPTLAAFVTDSYLPYIKGYKRSWETDVSLLKNHIIPTFGAQYMDEITKRDIINFIGKHRTTHAAGSTNRIVIMMRYIFNLAMRWETVGVTKNPTKDIPLLDENNKRERYLSEVETQTLFQAVQASENKMLQYIVPMLIVTGSRKREVLDAKWSEFDFENRIWRISKTKLGKARHVPMSDGVISILQSVPRIEDCEYVFANPDTKQPYVSIFCSWNTARTKAGLKDVRMHDLRHSFASFLVNSGRSIYEVQKLLGHTQIKTTQRYAHLSQDTLLEATNMVSKLVPTPTKKEDSSKK